MGNGPCTQFEHGIFDVLPYKAIWFDLDTPETLFDYLIYADIRLVRFEYLKQLVADRRLWPRRQEAEQEKIGTRDALVTMEEMREQRQLSRSRGLSLRDMTGPSACDPVLARTFSGRLKKYMQGAPGCLNQKKQFLPKFLQNLQNFRQNGHFPQRVHLLTVSHCWESKQHPDPWGSQLRRLVNIISAYQEAVFEVAGVESAECWIFIDFMCLPQYPRNAVQQQCFQRAMKSMHMLYAHKAVDRVVRLEDLTSYFEKLFPPKCIDIYHEEAQVQQQQQATVTDKAGQFGPRPFGELELNSTPYNARGWCIAETQWMSASSCIHGCAPMLPDTFQKRVQEMVSRFTHRSDAKAVVQLQEMVFWKKATACRELDVAWLPRDEFLLLTEALLHYVHLTELRIFHCDIGSELAAALVNTLRSLRELRVVRIFQCSISDEAASVLADFFKLEQSIESWHHRSSVEGCCCGPRTTLRLSLHDCQVEGVGQAVLAEAGLHMQVTPTHSEILWFQTNP